ncbi:hypothetical protein H5410_037973 [Solanum commersonii]|uniref:Uncharacterized protein n=1 Tax=Solanum commersonii TaxID=4109 RepID=A0A9J5Y9F2_SOLCO|nr:hypothetical protein H5410_037973 [Solanum commersonii]
MNEAKRSAKAMGCKDTLVGERSALERSLRVSGGGESRSENIGLSNINIVADACQCRKVKEVGDRITWESTIEAPVNGDCNYNDPKVEKFLVGLIFPKRSHRWKGLAPRCRLFATWGCSMFQGLGCLPIKTVREPGSKRRETVRSISVIGVKALIGHFPSTRRLGRTHL